MATVTQVKEGVENDYFEYTKRFVITWGPRACFALLAGYYSLGIAYEIGLMATLDRFAIRILKNSVGYAGIGAFMPTFQWYSAKAVQITSAAAGGLVYDLSERIVLYATNRCFKKTRTPQDAHLPIRDLA